MFVGREREGGLVVEETSTLPGSSGLSRDSESMDKYVCGQSLTQVSSNGGISRSVVIDG